MKVLLRFICLIFNHDWHNSNKAGRFICAVCGKEEDWR